MLIVRSLQKPFPDRTFYVFGGRPYCDYHYHLANKSLCNNRICGLPIEGPCAEDHEGNRYHPDHLVCDEAGCGERLVEYLDISGKKYCDRHGYGGGSSNGSSRGRRSEERERESKGSTEYAADDGAIPELDLPPVPPPRDGTSTPKPMKRRTRFLEI